MNTVFHTHSRQSFRDYFQPSRIVLGVFRADTSSGVNVITLCFDMYCSYKPPMMAFSIQQGAFTYSLLGPGVECVLAIPGESLAPQAMICGTTSGLDCDKVAACKFTLIPSETVNVPGIAEAIANIEMRIKEVHDTGDHRTAFGEVLRFAVRESATEKCLLSVGRDTSGYRVLARSGIHRIAVVDLSGSSPGE